jgi:hypothetical protein
LILEGPAVTTFGTVSNKSASKSDAAAVLDPPDLAGSSASRSSMDVQAPGLAVQYPATVDDRNQPVWREVEGRLDGTLGIQPLDPVAEDFRVYRGRLQSGFALLEGLGADVDDLADLVARGTLGR